MSHDMGRLHHVGHVVRDMGEALNLYRRLGFTLAPPTYPAMAPGKGAAPEPFGAANTHADFPRNFVEVVTCVAEADLDATEARYQDYLGSPAQADGSSRFFDLDGARLTLVPDSHLSTTLPGEHAPAVPAFVAYAVAVRDLAATRTLLHENGFSVGRTDSGDIFVPAASALGAAIIFREASQVRR